MSTTSKIEWTDATWNPVTGCTKVSQGCKNCYAEKFYERFNGKGSFKTITCHDDRLLIPGSWKKPRMVFVNSMSDLFHEDVPFEFIDKVWDIMFRARKHTFQILTKRAERMMDYFDFREQRAKERYGKLCLDIPLDNVWLGVSCEDQATANERIPFLLNTPAAIRFLSCEPLLGPIDLSKISTDKQIFDLVTNASICIEEKTPGLSGWLPLAVKIDWIITGGESGPGARPMHPDWVRSIRDQCKAAGVAFFFKQWGEWIQYAGTNAFYKNEIVFTADEGQKVMTTNPTAVVMKKLGKNKNGNYLDGVQHLEFPVEPQKEQKKTKEKF